MLHFFGNEIQTAVSQSVLHVIVKNEFLYEGFEHAKITIVAPL